MCGHSRMGACAAGIISPTGVWAMAQYVLMGVGLIGPLALPECRQWPLAPDVGPAGMPAWVSVPDRTSLAPVNAACEKVLAGFNHAVVNYEDALAAVHAFAALLPRGSRSNVCHVRRARCQVCCGFLPGPVRGCSISVERAPSGRLMVRPCRRRMDARLWKVAGLRFCLAMAMRTCVNASVVGMAWVEHWFNVAPSPSALVH